MKKKLLIIAIFTIYCSVSASGQISVHHINVGQGDATLLEFKTAAVMN
jgi:hypothetical protein